MIFDNKEWMSGHNKGYTDFGWASPITLTVTQDSDIAVKTGAYFFHRYGENSQVDHRPILSLQYSASETQLLSFGTLNQPDEIHPALMQPVRLLSDPLAEGIQWRLDTEKINTVLWLDWNILETSDTAERFNTGFHIEWQPMTNLWLQHTLLHDHTDGQITNDPTSKRIYGTYNSLFWESDFPKQRPKIRMGAAVIDSQADVNDLISKGFGTEVFITADMNQAHWLHQLTLSHYWGSGQVTGGFVLYQHEQLDTLKFTSTYLASNNMNIELALAIDWVNLQANTSQKINVIWSLGHSSLIQPDLN